MVSKTRWVVASAARNVKTPEICRSDCRNYNYLLPLRISGSLIKFSTIRGPQQMNRPCSLQNKTEGVKISRQCHL
jgi:hypothetical protein